MKLLGRLNWGPPDPLMPPVKGGTLFEVLAYSAVPPLALASGRETQKTLLVSFVLTMLATPISASKATAEPSAGCRILAPCAGVKLAAAITAATRSAPFVFIVLGWVGLVTSVWFSGSEDWGWPQGPSALGRIEATIAPPLVYRQAHQRKRRAEGHAFRLITSPSRQ